MPKFTFARTIEEIVTISADNLEDATDKMEYSGQDLDWIVADISDIACVEQEG